MPPGTHRSQRRAVAVHTRLTEDKRRALAEALERLPRAAFLVDGGAAVRHANAAGAALLAAWVGAPTPGRAGRRGRRGSRKPRCRGVRSRRRRAAAVRIIPRPAGLSACPAPRPARRSWPAPVPLSAAGLVAAGLPPEPMALLLVADPEARPQTPPPAALREAFGLAKAEAVVAARADTDERAPSPTAPLAIFEGTARLHLHRVFEKTGAHRRAELAAVPGRLGP